MANPISPFVRQINIHWHLDGQDRIGVARTAYSDGVGGPNRYHDANVFHLIASKT